MLSNFFTPIFSGISIGIAIYGLDYFLTEVEVKKSIIHTLMIIILLIILINNPVLGFFSIIGCFAGKKIID
jgi:hypothetical protein